MPLLGVAAAALVRSLLDPTLKSDAPLLVFFLPIAVAGYFGGLLPGLVATTAGCVAGLYLFVEPRRSMAVSQGDALRVALFLLEGVIISGLAEALHQSRRRAAAEAHALRGARDSLAASRSRLAGIIESAMDAIVSVDEQQRIVVFNPAAEHVFRCSAAEAIGTPLERFIPERFRARHADDVRAFGRTHVTTRTMGRLGTLYGVRADGEEFPIEASISHVDQDGQRLYTVILRDVTERARVEQEREELYRAANDANRVKDEFLATLSHELRTPLNVILGWCWRLRRGDPGQWQRGIDVIERNARAQHRLIEDLLDVSRIAQGHIRLDRRPIDLRPIVEAVVEASRLSAEASGLALTLTALPDRPVTVSGDAHRLQQVAWNLLANAIKFTPQGGRVTVRLEAVDDSAALVVSDTGQGIPADFLPFVFERFRQADSSTTRRHGGLGLGMAITRTIVELHGGSVSAASEGVNAGATFVVRLPRLPGRIDVRPSLRWRRRADDPDTLVGLRLLIVDDETDTRELLSGLMRSWGAEVDVAASADEALSVLRRRLPDVLVCDIGMPGRDGYSLVREVRSLEPEAGGGVPAVALTAYASAADRARALAAGFQLHIAKPVDPEELRAAIATLAPARARVHSA